MLKALIVEDETLMREYLMVNLNNIHSGWIAAGCARNGIEAIAQLKEHRFDLVITDIKMPGMGGLELASYIRSHDMGTDVILLTGYDEFSFAQAAIRSKVADYLLKPLHDEELNRILDHLATQRGTWIAQNERQGESENNEKKTEDTCFQTENSHLLTQRVRNYIERHFQEPISLNEIANIMQVNPAYLSSIFKSDRGESYSKFVLRLRMERAAVLLRTQSMENIGDIAIDVGYLSAKHFISVFKKYYGVTPAEFRNYSRHGSERTNNTKTE